MEIAHCTKRLGRSRRHALRICKTGNREEGIAGKEKPNGRHARNYGCAELLKRVFEFDVLECPECGGRMRMLCAINPPEAIRRIHDCLGLPSRASPISPAVEEICHNIWNTCMADPGKMNLCKFPGFSRTCSRL